MKKYSLFVALIMSLSAVVYADPKAESPVKGGTHPLVTIVTFVDYQCPFCIQSSKTMNEILNAYGDKVQLVFKNMPLPASFHPEAMSAARAGVCAYAQDKFWQMNDLLMAKNGELNASTYNSLAADLGLNLFKFENCMKSDSSKASVDADLDYASTFQIPAVPSFLLISKTRTVKFAGALPYADIKEKIDDLLVNP